MSSTAPTRVAVRVAADAGKVLQNRALQCSFTSVFHIKKTADTAKALREAKEVERIFINAVGGPMAFMGFIGGMTYLFKK